MNRRIFFKMFKFKNDFNDSDMLAFGIGIVLFIFGSIVIIDPFKISESMLLCLGVFALLIGIASTIKHKLSRNISMLFSVVIPVIIFLFLRKLDLDLSNSNNGVSLLAISYTIFILPFSRTNREREQEELNRLNRTIESHDNEMTKATKDSEERIKQLTEEKNERIREIIKEKDARIEEITQEKDARIEEITQEKDARIEEIIKEKDERFKVFETQERNNTLTMRQQHQKEIKLLKDKVVLLESKLSTSKSLNSEIKKENTKLKSQQIISLSSEDYKKYNERLFIDNNSVLSTSNKKTRSEPGLISNSNGLYDFSHLKINDSIMNNEIVNTSNLIYEPTSLFDYSHLKIDNPIKKEIKTLSSNKLNDKNRSDR